MAKTITQLPDATTVGESDEMIVQQSGITKRATIGELKAQVATLGARDITVSTANRSITNTGNFALSFGTNNAERVRIANDGKVMINTPSNDGRVLTINGTTNDLAGIGIVHSGASAASIAVNSDGAMTFGLNLSDGKTERMRIDASGNVGIGTSPSDRLHVVGTGTNAGTGYAVSRFMDSANAKGVFLGYDTDETAGTIYGVNLLTFQTYSGSSWGERMRIDASGNVGIGTTSPSEKLQINGNARLVGSNGIFFEINNGSDATYVSQEATAELRINQATNTTDSKITLLTRGTERMRIDASGNVGIGGTANAAAILDAASTTKGFLPPRMTTAQRDAISTPPAGLVIYNTSTNVLNFYNGTAWAAV